MATGTLKDLKEKHYLRVSYDKMAVTRKMDNMTTKVLVSVSNKIYTAPDAFADPAEKELCECIGDALNEQLEKL